jgi:uracil-DNA glycosylase family 4
LRRLQVLDALESEWADCQKCALAAQRNRVVGWRGNPHAQLFIVGEAPGETEDRVGRPFVGMAGHILDAALVQAGLDPTEDAFIANTVGCRPPGNRIPEREETKACAKRLHQFLRVADPKVLLLLGATAAKLAGAYSVTRQRGIETFVEVLCYDGRVRMWPSVVTYHPAYVIRTGGRAGTNFGELVSDIQLAYKLAKNS